jgi:hypothetical protein
MCVVTVRFVDIGGIVNDKKNLHIFASTQKDHILSQKWMTRYKHGEYNSKVNQCS